MVGELNSDVTVFSVSYRKDALAFNENLARFHLRTPSSRQRARLRVVPTAIERGAGRVAGGRRGAARAAGCEDGGVGRARGERGSRGRGELCGLG
jgi:hypothetical protein